MSVFVVYGLPGAGKRSILAAVAQQVQTSANYIFAKPDVDVYEKDTPDTTNENVVSPEEFERNKSSGLYVCEWSYAKSRYALPESYFTQLAYRTKLLLNVPSSAISAIEARCKQQQYKLQLVHVVAPADVLQSRLRALPDKRESKHALRQLKEETEAAATTTTTITSTAQTQAQDAAGTSTATSNETSVLTLNNDGMLAAAVTAMVQIIGFNPNTDIKQLGQFNLETCTPQEYLQRTIYPYINQALELVDRERPADPIEYLGLYLYECVRVCSSRVSDLNATHELREDLRKHLHQEYTITGRV